MDELSTLLEQYKKKFNMINDKSLAEHLGLSNAYLCDIRKGRRRLSDKLIIKMANELKVNHGRYLIAARFAYANEAEEKLAWKKLLKHYLSTQEAEVI